MRAKKIAFPFLLIVSTCVFGQDALVLPVDLTFTSEFEKAMFDAHLNKAKPEVFNMFMASSQTLNEKAIDHASRQFHEFIRRVNTEKIQSKKNDRKVKLIYDDVHAAFLRKYELENRFEDIFINGYYNCVSATALYALVFEKLNIPYVIKEKPTHVYLIAYPSAERIIVETTTPAGGFVTINPQFKQSYVKILRDQKLITAQEYSKGSVNELFDRFYFGADQDITLIQLLGVQYSNAGIYHYQTKNYSDAFEEFKKSYMFYPSDRVAHMLLASAHEVFRARSSKDSIHASTLAMLARFGKYGITQDMIRGEYANVVEDLLFNRGEKEKLEKYHQVLTSGIKNASLNEELDFFYQYENGRMQYNQAHYRDALPYFETCLKLRPKNQEATRIFLACFSESTRNRTNAEGIKLLEDYASAHPQLLENNVFNEMVGTAYLIEMRTSFSAEQPTQGEKFKAMFEDFHSTHSEVAFNHYLIGEAYSSAAVYYFRKGNTAKARTVLTRGLVLSPNNYELVTRKRMIN